MQIDFKVSHDEVLRKLSECEKTKDNYSIFKKFVFNKIKQYDGVSKLHYLATLLDIPYVTVARFLVGSYQPKRDMIKVWFDKFKNVLNLSDEEQADMIAVYGNMIESKMFKIPEYTEIPISSITHIHVCESDSESISVEIIGL